MAWLSVGETNDDLCDKLLEHGVLQQGNIMNAFRHTDRGDFVQQDNRYDKDNRAPQIILVTSRFDHP